MVKGCILIKIIFVTEYHFNQKKQTAFSLTVKKRFGKKSFYMFRYPDIIPGVNQEKNGNVGFKESLFRIVLELNPEML